MPPTPLHMTFPWKSSVKSPEVGLASTLHSRKTITEGVPGLDPGIFDIVGQSREIVYPKTGQR
jgi:hypothetical protein